ncbi:MAG: polysaccharide biosynthesis/export family protein [Candidatus Symbiothrix sp.]|jgi:polysaccharide export outer membrane protein|nr:polysaccharide biosynthesis/export family protein [Candidatus Symbiothrix sp.]
MTGFNHFMYGVTCVVAVLFSACGSSKDIIYFQGVADDTTRVYNDLATYEIKIVPKDNLFINVSTSTSNPLAAVPYNAIDMTRGGGYISAMEYLGYLVDENGDITFPGLGKVRVGGLTKKEATELIRKGLEEYIEQPIVNIRFLNYKISVLGEVNRPGTFVIGDERISIPEAIARAGDMTIYGQRHNVLVCRIDNGEKKFFKVDITSPAMFYSESYYLHQNDILYVLPNKSRVMGASYNPMISTYLSVAGLLVSITTLIISISRK